MECETECLELIPEEAMNCVHQCLSSECFSKIYGSELLEPGEIDWERATEMDKCVKEEIAEERRKKRREKI